MAVAFQEHSEMNGKPPSDSPIGRGNHLDQMQQLMDEAMKDVRSGLSPPPSEGRTASSTLVILETPFYPNGLLSFLYKRLDLA